MALALSFRYFPINNKDKQEYPSSKWKGEYLQHWERAPKLLFYGKGIAFVDQKDAWNNILHLARFFVFMEAIHARGFGVIISV